MEHDINEAVKRQHERVILDDEFGRPFGFSPPNKSTEQELIQEIAYWDEERITALNALVFATQERVACSIELNKLSRVWIEPS